MSLYLTFDLGTTSLKTALIDDGGRPLAIHTEEYTPETPGPDRVEMRPEVYWRAVVEGTRAVLSKGSAYSSALTAIGFSSQGQTFVPVDRAGRPLYNAIGWVDNRAQSLCDAWEAAWLSREKYRRISGYPWLPAGLTLFQVAWLAQHVPQAHRAWKFLLLPDYIIYRLTGETATDRVMAQFSGFYNLQTGDWDAGLLAAAGITEKQLPRLLEPGAVAGQVTDAVAAELGIPAGLPVCVGANDQIVGAVGAGNVHAGIVSETTGTALALIATTDKLLDDTRICVGRHALPDAFFVLSFTITSAIVLKWFRDLCRPGEDYDTFLRGVEAVPPGCEGLTVLPHFAGTASPTFNPHVRGAFVGLTLGHTRSHIARAIMEACACMLQECLEPLVERSLPIQTIRSLGGAARNDLWLQMKADLLGVPVERPACSDAASVGAAALAAAGIGQYASVSEVADAWYRPAQVFEPDRSRYDIYREIYARYLTLYERLYAGGAWDAGRA